MADKTTTTRASCPWLLLVVVTLALFTNGLSWAVRVPPLHPNDEAQHYLYAATFDGAGDPVERDEDEVPRDLQALAELADFGPQREVRRAIDLSENRAEQIQRLTAEADDPALATRYVEDSDTNKLIGHSAFEKYHPPIYYVATGQVLRLGHAMGLGVRGRLLLGRLFSVALGLVAAWLAVWLALIVWPRNWGLAALVGLALGWQATVAFYTSVLNNDALTFPLFTAFLLLGAMFLRKWLAVSGGVALVGVGLVAILTKFTALALVPLGLLAVMFSDRAKRVRLAALVAFLLLGGGVAAWLLVPLGGGGGLAADYLDSGAQARSFPAEMFTVERFKGHAKVAGHLWGNYLGNAVVTDAGVSKPTLLCFLGGTALAYLLGLVRLLRVDRAQRRVMLWLLFPPVLIYLLLYTIDYRFASMSGGRFFSRPQYFVMCSSAVMIWTIWGLLGWFKGRVFAMGAAALALVAMAYNLVFLVGRIGPRYYGPIDWWGQCEAVATLWPVPAWGVAGLDALTVLTGLAAVAAVSRSIARNGH